MSPAPLARAAQYVANLEFEFSGTLDLRERLPPREGSEYFDTGQLLSVESEDIDMEIGYCTDPNTREPIGYYIELRAPNQRDPETDRVFHATLTVHPTRGDIVRLRDFLDFLLRQPDA
jgi:hypothetical protein